MEYSGKWYHWLWLPGYLLLSVEVLVMYWRNWRRALRYLGWSVLCLTADIRASAVREKVALLTDYQETYQYISYSRGWEAQLEAVPQLVLQLYIIAEDQQASKSHMFLKFIPGFLTFDLQYIFCLVKVEFC